MKTKTCFTCDVQGEEFRPYQIGSSTYYSCAKCEIERIKLQYKNFPKTKEKHAPRFYGQPPQRK